MGNVEVTVWSAGKNGIYSKVCIAFGVFSILSWVMLLVVVTIGAIYNINGIGNMHYAIIGILLVLFTFFVGLMGILAIKIALRAYKNNREITMHLIEKEKFTGTSAGEFVVFADTDGIVTCSDPDAYSDWRFFTGEKTFQGFLSYRYSI